MNNMNDTFSLNSVKEGLYRVVSLHGGRGFLKKLADLGVYPDVELKVLSPAIRGPIRVSVKGSHFGLGRGIASRIIVREVTKKEKVFTLRDYREGQRGRIVEIKGEGRFKKRILEMGFVRGTLVYVEKYAPLRDPIEFIVKGYHVGLRRDEAEKIIMTEPF